jgi:hypothetical protein
MKNNLTQSWSRRCGRLPLPRASAPADAAGAPGPAAARLRRWFELLIAIKRKKARDDAELFATYYTLAVAARDVAADHVEALIGQLARIIGDGVESGEFTVADPAAAARAVFDATARFHSPVAWPTLARRRQPMTWLALWSSEQVSVSKNKSGDRSSCSTRLTGDWRH